MREKYQAVQLLKLYSKIITKVHKKQWLYIIREVKEFNYPSVNFACFMLSTMLLNYSLK